MASTHIAKHGTFSRLGYDAEDLRSLATMAMGAAILIPGAAYLLGGIEPVGPEVFRWIPDVAPLVNAAPVVLIHLAVALLGIFGGAAILFLRKGTARHRLLGRLWMGGILATAITGLLIEPYRFSAAHPAALIVFAMVPYAIIKVRQGDSRAHRRAVAHLIIAMFIVGFLTLMPGHLLHPVFFAPAP
jgi:uncharacterized membrane protein